MVVDMNPEMVEIQGMEMISFEKIAQDIRLNVLPLASRNKYVLICFKEESIPSFALNTFFEMQLMGYVPVIAHVEKNLELVNHPKKLRAFVERGALVHVDAASILGENGKVTQRKALKLCRSGLVHLVSSTSSDSKKDLFLQKSAYAYVKKKLSLTAVEYFIRNAESVMNGSDFHMKNPKQMGRGYFNR